MLTETALLFQFLLKQFFGENCRVIERFFVDFRSYSIEGVASNHLHHFLGSYVGTGLWAFLLSSRRHRAATTGWMLRAIDMLHATVLGYGQQLLVTLMGWGLEGAITLLVIGYDFAVNAIGRVHHLLLCLVNILHLNVFSRCSSFSHVRPISVQSVCASCLPSLHELARL